MKKITDVLVVGGGVAGLLAAINLKSKLPALSVRLLAHPLEDDFALDAIAAGPAFLTHIHQELGLNPMTFLRAVGPVWRLGTRYQWGPRDYFDYSYEFQIDTRYAKLQRESGFFIGNDPRAFENCGPASALMSNGKIFYRGPDGRPQIVDGKFGYHIPHKALLNLLVEMAKHARVQLIEGKLADAIRDENGITEVRLQNGQALTADLYVDATGLGSLLLGKALESKFESFAPALGCDRALVGSLPRGQIPIAPNSFVSATEAGWLWRCDLLPTITCGHMYSSAHCDDQKAEAALRAAHRRCGTTRLLKFRQGRYEKAWNGNVVGIGHAAAFMEPLAAAGPDVLAFQCQWLSQTLVDCEQTLRPTLIKQFNKRWARLVDGEREFLALFYKFSNRSEPFWRESRENTSLGDLEPVAKLYHELGPDSLYRHTLLYENDPLGMEAYFSVLVGQNVPWDFPFVPSAQEQQQWQTIVEAWQRRAASAFTIEEALRMLIAASSGSAQRTTGRAMQPV